MGTSPAGQYPDSHPAHCAPAHVSYEVPVCRTGRRDAGFLQPLPHMCLMTVCAAGWPSSLEGSGAF